MYILEGNIGVGKSTFLKLIKENLPAVNILTEPKDNWTNQIYGQSLLENFYKDPKRWAYTLETLAMICRSRDHVREQATPGKVIIERSIYSGHYCFAANGYKSGFFSSVEWGIYQKWAEFLIEQKCNPPKGFIYLKADADVCYSRIKKRNRISEKKVNLSYIKQIDDWHESFLIKKENVTESIKNTPVLTLDCNQDFIENPDRLTKHLYLLNNFIEKTSSQPLPNKQASINL